MSSSHSPSHSALVSPLHIGGMSSSSSSPPLQRSLRTPAGLSLSYEHGGRGRREAIEERKIDEAKEKAKRDVHADEESKRDDNAQHQYHPHHPAYMSGIDQARRSMVVPIPKQTSLTANLNRIGATRTSSAPPIDAAELESRLEQTRLSEKAKEDEAASMRNASATSSTTSSSPSSHTSSSSAFFPPSSSVPTVPLSSVARHRLHLSALLSASLSAPCVISPLPSGRGADLAHLLASRRSPADLVRRNIMRRELSDDERRKQAAQREKQRAEMEKFWDVHNRTAPANRARRDEDALRHANILHGEDADEAKQSVRQAMLEYFEMRPSMREVRRRLGMSPLPRSASSPESPRMLSASGSTESIGDAAATMTADANGDAQR